MMDMATTLIKEGKRQFLKAHWYVAKDREVPADASANERNSHGVSEHRKTFCTLANTPLSQILLL